MSRLLSALGHEVILAHARNVRLIGESRKKDDRLDAQTFSSPGPDRCTVAEPGETSQRESAIRPDGNPGASGIGAGSKTNFLAELERVVQGEITTVDPCALLFVAAEVILEGRKADEQELQRSATLVLPIARSSRSLRGAETGT